VEATSFGRNTEDRRKQLGDLLERHRSTFSDEPGLTDKIEFSTDTGQEKPVVTAPRQPPLRWEKQHDATIEDLYQKGILEDSNSPWASATHCVPKGDTGCRVVVDTRSVNSRTVPDPYPMPRPSAILDAVAASPYISTLDLNSGYYQIPKIGLRRLSSHTRASSNLLGCPLVLREHLLASND
jgi:hypothetical protein